MSASTPRRLLPRFAVAGLLALLAALPAAAQQAGGAVLDLRIVEVGSGEPLADARVAVEGIRYPVWSDREGRVRVPNIAPGERMVIVSRPGYTAERVNIGFGTARVEGEVELRVLPVTLAPVRVVADQQIRSLRERDFYNRVRHGHGAVVMRDEIERMRPRNTMDVMRRLRGFQVNYNPAGQVFLTSSRGRGSFGGGCQPQVYLDGVLMWMEPGRVDPSDIVHPEQIEAIEAYAGAATIPPELNATGSACGVVAIWTRSGP
jgi:hypothetical protein